MNHKEQLEALAEQPLSGQAHSLQTIYEELVQELKKSD